MDMKEYNDKMNRKVEWACRIIIALLLAGGILLACSSCKSTNVVQPDVVELPQVSFRDTIHTSTYSSDIVIRDTFMIYLNAEGETQKEVSRHSEVQKILVTDTLYITNTDSVRVPVYVTRIDKQAYIPTWIWVALISLLLAVIILILLLRLK